MNIKKIKLLHDKDYIKTMNDKIDKIKRKYALSVYNIQNIHNIPDDQIQLIINDKLFQETLLIKRQVNFVFMF